jgi:hypothetical protein
VADTVRPAEHRTTLKLLGAEVTVWREDYVHPDGWPQRYKIDLHFTGYTGRAPVTLPPAHSGDTDSDNKQYEQAAGTCTQLGGFCRRGTCLASKNVVTRH